MPKLGVVVASTREGRAGLPIANWFVGVARQHGAFDVSVADLKEIDLPLLQEPHHPREQKYTSEKTRAWSARIAALDAFVFVTPEYNFNPPPALINALDHLYVEWNYKAAGFVSYGGISGGMRSVQMTKLLLTTLKMVPLYEAVALPFFAKQLDSKAGVFAGNETQERAANVMLDELVRWTSALARLRE
jgi:NAD(P)H-dependent FMN reductase